MKGGRTEAPARKKGAARMAQLGYKQVQVWLDENELRNLEWRFPDQRMASVLRRLLCEACKIHFHYR